VSATISAGLSGARPIRSSMACSSVPASVWVSPWSAGWIATITPVSRACSGLYARCVVPSFIRAMRAAGGDAQSAFDRVLFWRLRSKRIRSWALGVSMPLSRAQHLLVILAGIPAHKSAHGGLLGRGADPLGADQIVLVRDLEQKAEHGVLQRQPGHAECRGHRLAIRQAEKAMQRQGIGAPPGDFPLGLQTFKLADEQHAEVAAWRDRRAANAVLVVLLAQHLDGFVELGQHLMAPVVKRVSGSTARRLPLPAAFRRLLSLAMPSGPNLHYTNVHRFNTSPVCQRTVTEAITAVR